MPRSSGAPSIPTHERFAERIFEVELERSIARANESLLPSSIPMATTVSI